MCIHFSWKEKITSTIKKISWTEDIQMWLLWLANDLSNIKKHQKAKHVDFVLKCKICDYMTEDKSHLNCYIRVKHLVKNIKYNQCVQFFAENQDLKRHVNAKRTLKMCNECNFTPISIRDMKTLTKMILRKNLLLTSWSTIKHRK